MRRKGAREEKEMSMTKNNRGGRSKRRGGA